METKRFRFEWTKRPRQIFWNRKINLKILELILILTKFDPILSLGSILSLLFIFSYSVFLVEIPEFFKGASYIGQTFYQLAFAYLASTIFYFVTIHWRLEKKKLANVSFLWNRCSALYSHFHNVKQGLTWLAGIHPLRHKLDEVHIEKICKMISTRTAGNSYIYGKLNNPLELFPIYLRRQRQVTQDIMRFSDICSDRLLFTVNKHLDVAERSFERYPENLANVDLLFICRSLIECNRQVEEILEVCNEDFGSYLQLSVEADRINPDPTRPDKAYMSPR